MTSASGQGFNSNRIYRRWLAETFDGHEIAEDELSDNLFENDDIIQPSIGKLPINLETLEPYVGMEFESVEDAREFYEIYGRRVGFTIRNNRTRRSLKDNSIIGREFVCSKEGFRPDKYANRENRILPSRPPTREGCNAMLRITAKDGGKWVIYGFIKEHNHELNPSKIPPRRLHRSAFCEYSRRTRRISRFGNCPQIFIERETGLPLIKHCYRRFWNVLRNTLGGYP